MMNAASVYIEIHDADRTADPPERGWELKNTGSQRRAASNDWASACF
jgi:hypothetical protein